MGGEDGDVMPGVGFAGDVEVLVSIFGEGLEEEGEERIDVFPSSDGVGNGGTAVGEAGVDGLV